MNGSVRFGPAALAAMLLISIPVATFAQPGGDQPPRSRRRPRDVRRPRQRLPKNTKVLRDIEYARVGNRSLKLDLYVPDHEPGQRLPLVVWVHGGAWRGGSKDRTPAVALLEHDYAVASVSYRFSQEAIFPAQIHDCKAAVRWLRAHAGRHDLDPNRFGAWGASAGGHLVALLGTSAGVKEMDGTVGKHLDQSTAVQAVCDFFGPTDFLAMVGRPSRIAHGTPGSPESRLIGGTLAEHPDRVKKANPITYVGKDDPPFLIVHGDSDPAVPPNQSKLLHEALKKAGAKAKLYLVKGGGHGGFRDPNVPAMVRRFFDKHLKAGAAKKARPATRPTADAP